MSISFANRQILCDGGEKYTARTARQQPPMAPLLEVIPHVLPLRDFLLLTHCHMPWPGGGQRAQKNTAYRDRGAVGPSSLRRH